MARSYYDPRDDMFSSGDALRDVGIEQALSGEEQAKFNQRVMEYVRKLPKGWEGTTEDWRRALGIKAPRSPNAWGALTRTAASYGLIADTGRMQKPDDPKSHSRPTKVWRRL